VTKYVDSVSVHLSVCLSLRLSVCLLQVGVLQKWLKVGLRKQRHTIARDCSFLLPKISVKLNGGAKCSWGTLNTTEVAENWRLSTRSVVNLARLQVYRTFTVLQCVAQGLSATADPCTLLR